VADLEGAEPAPPPIPFGRRTDAVTVPLISDNGTLLWQHKKTNHMHNKEDRVMPPVANTYRQLPNIFTVLQYLISNFLPRCSSSIVTGFNKFWWISTFTFRPTVGFHIISFHSVEVDFVAEGGFRLIDNETLAEMADSADDDTAAAVICLTARK